MSAFGLHPTFNDLPGYRAWRAVWHKLHTALERRAALQPDDPDMIAMLAKSRALLSAAQERMRRIREMHAQLAEQMASFPLTIEAPSIDFHFNKVSLEFPFMPAWTLKAKGRSFYVRHVDFECVGTTRETPGHPSTKGAIRFRQVVLDLSTDGSARISRRIHAAVRDAA